ncbi:unnamed protein product [Lupinus luteus]|uniref:Uncharacterized protein n=1 Tax=Lupinus luteus TaxID=3873 RepID=A0AAV1XP09_LUPLU
MEEWDLIKEENAEIKCEIERLEGESRQLYGIQRWKNVDFKENCGPKIKANDPNAMHLANVFKTIMAVISMLLFSVLFYPVSVKVDQEVFDQFPQLKSISTFLKNIVYVLSHRLHKIQDLSVPVLVEYKMTEKNNFKKLNKHNSHQAPMILDYVVVAPSTPILRKIHMIYAGIIPTMHDVVLSSTKGRFLCPMPWEQNIHRPGMVEGQNIAIDGELNLDSFPQEHVDSYTQDASLTNNVNLGSNEDNDTWMN